MSLKPSICSSISLSMELSRTSPPQVSTARIPPRPSLSFGKNITTTSMPTKFTCKYSRFSHSHIIPPSSEFHSDKSSLNLFYQPKSSLPNVAPQVSCWRKGIPLAKANGDQIETDKSECLPLTKVLKFCEVVLRFLRPPVVFGVVIGFIAVLTRTCLENIHLVMIHKWILLLRAVAVVVAFVCSSCVVNGINQIYDIEIDKINKLHYPLASGELSLRSAWILVISSVAMGISISIILKSKLLLASFLCSYVLALLYSVPPVSTKRSTIGALFTCAALRFTFTLGMAAAARNIMGLSFQLSMPVVFITLFSTFFTLALGALKDIEDLEGDKKCDVPTLASIYGPRKVAFFGFGLILLTYTGAIATAVLMPQVFRRSIMVPTHVILASYLIIQAWKLEKANYSKEASVLIYESLWKILTVEFIIFPLI